jgi:predicted CopG family antitoxin
VKNITLSVSEDVYRRARLKAAAENTSLSRVVSRFLEDYGAEEERIAAARAQMETLFRKVKGFGVGKKIPREEIHARRRLR